MAIKHQIVTFVTAETALMAMIWSKKKGELETANPLPKRPVPKASDEELKAFQAKCGRINEKISGELKSAIAEVIIVEEQGHPDLPDDHVVRSWTENRCRLVGCEKSVKKSIENISGIKANRYARAFCKRHLHLRYQIPRKKGFFVLRNSSTAGLRIAA